MGWPSFKKYLEFKISRWEVHANYNGSKVVKVLVPEVYINGKFNTIMEKTLKTMLNGPYVVINQLIKSI
jgi:hypothetical protein